MEPLKEFYEQVKYNFINLAYNNGGIIPTEKQNTNTKDEKKKDSVAKKIINNFTYLAHTNGNGIFDSKLSQNTYVKKLKKSDFNNTHKCCTQTI